jgi:cell division septum initiation protein DivIVA
MKAQLDRVQRDKAAAEQAARQMQAELEQVRAQGPGVGAGSASPGGDGEQQALRVLMMAQRTADDHVSDARREADKLLSDARSKAEEVTREARAKADALERDARQRHQEAMGGLDAKRSALQKHIEELKQFEREYRTRLKAYLESQLRDLDGRGQGLEAEMSRTDASRSVGGSGGLAAAGLAGSYGGGQTGR